MRDKDETRAADGKALDRRGFLRTLGGASTMAAAAIAAPLAVGEAEAAESADERTKARYRETDHVKTFYRVNRY